MTTSSAESIYQKWTARYNSLTQNDITFNNITNTRTHSRRLCQRLTYHEGAWRTARSAIHRGPTTARSNGHTPKRTAHILGAATQACRQVSLLALRTNHDNDGGENKRSRARRLLPHSSCEPEMWLMHETHAPWGSNNFTGSVNTPTTVIYLLGNTVKIVPLPRNAEKNVFMFYKHTRSVYRLHNTTCIIAVIWCGTNVHCHRASEHMIINTISRFKACNSLQKAYTLLGVFPQDQVVVSQQVQKDFTFIIARGSKHATHYAECSHMKKLRWHKPLSNLSITL